MSDRVIVMEQGRIMQVGAPRDLYRRPANRFVADFVGTASFIDVAPAEGDAAWRLPDGTTIRGVTGTATPSGRHQLMLRPESVRLQAGGSDTPPGMIGLAGKVRDVQYLGAFTEYLVDVAGAVVRVHADGDVPPGSAGTLAFASADARIVHLE